MTSTISQIKSIVNPVRRLYVDDWIKIGALRYEIDEIEYPTDAKLQAIDLLSRYESLTSQKLTKEHFVCGVEKPEHHDKLQEIRLDKYDSGSDTKELYKLFDAYQSAQKKIWFEGFEESLYKPPFGWTVFNESEQFFQVHKSSFEDSVKLSIVNYVFAGNCETLSDFIYHIDLFNRTASKPVVVNFSDNFLNELIK